VTIICLSFLTLGIFISLSNNLRYTAKQLSKDMVIVFFLDQEVTDLQKQAIEKELQASPLVTDVRFIGAEQAKEKFLEKFPDLGGIVENLGANPFPSSFEATLRRPDLSSSEAQPLFDKMTAMEGVEDVQFNRDWVEKMQSLSKLAQAVGFFLGGILILASFFIVSNVIKLNVIARKEEIEILRLVGGTNTFIRIPFLAEGVILGALGGMLSLFLIFLVIQLFPLYLGSALGILSELIHFRYLTLPQSLLLVLSGAGIGFLGSMSSLAKFLKI